MVVVERFVNACSSKQGVYHMCDLLGCVLPLSADERAQKSAQLVFSTLKTHDFFDVFGEVWSFAQHEWSKETLLDSAHALSSFALQILTVVDILDQLSITDLARRASSYGVRFSSLLGGSLTLFCALDAARAANSIYHREGGFYSNAFCAACGVIKVAEQSLFFFALATPQTLLFLAIASSGCGLVACFLKSSEGLGV